MTCAVGQPDGCPAATGAFSTAVALNDNGSATTADIGEASFNEKFAACPVVKYVRNGVDYAFYTRTSDIPSDFNAYSIFTYTWANSDNVLGTDFEIYSSLDDLKSGSNKWSFCNYNDPDVGFPRDCGPNGHIANTWFSFPGGKYDARGLTSGSGFELREGSDCPSTATLSPSPSPPPPPLEEHMSKILIAYGNFRDAGYVDAYRGWYDASGCGICQDYCRWVKLPAQAGTILPRRQHTVLRGGRAEPRKVRPAGTPGKTVEIEVRSVLTRCLDKAPPPPQPSLEEQCPISTSTADAGYVDAYRGWYDASGCGICQDYCRWVETLAQAAILPRRQHTVLRGGRAESRKVPLCTPGKPSMEVRSVSRNALTRRHASITHVETTSI